MGKTPGYEVPLLYNGEEVAQGETGEIAKRREDRDDSERPRLTGYPIGDMAGGVFSALSIVGALLDRELGNAEGDYLDVSMTDAVLSFSQVISSLANAGEDPRSGEDQPDGTVPMLRRLRDERRSVPDAGRAGAEVPAKPL